MDRGLLCARAEAALHLLGAVGRFARRSARPGLCRSAGLVGGGGQSPCVVACWGGASRAPSVPSKAPSREGGGGGRRKPVRPGCSCAALAGAGAGPSCAPHVPAFAGLRAPGRGEGGPVTTGRRRLASQPRTSCIRAAAAGLPPYSGPFTLGRPHHASQPCQGVRNHGLEGVEGGVGGHPPPFADPRMWYKTMRFVGARGARHFVLGRGPFFCLTLCAYTQNNQNFVENSKMHSKHKKAFDADRISGSDLG